MTPELLARAGEALRAGGDDWVRTVAEALGPRHPTSPRESLDRRMIQRWATGAMDIPPWVPGALAEALREAGDRLHDVAQELDAVTTPPLPGLIR
ncbi:hypothetical protein MKK88_04665 [Methylobacterium sp. E-005]|uniref:hypothetical protein n=1 Tax=Methylobacterium sp. E-005 TaxID=2836549 RepID=UPI001FBB2BE1|nr:hypothetical protein [Methylobacterium sp. E-005]MCJ2085289.1 hypothetical protein [Methylobacterium sp. E-005]